MSFWTDEAESAALKLNELDPRAGSHTAAAALYNASEDCETYRLHKSVTK